jgi:predicted RNA binding protein YcfA (HicA-like mRNA interferase family)
MGFAPARQKGSHVFYRHADGRTTTLPNHPGRDISPSLLRKVLGDLSVSVDEFLKYL